MLPARILISALLLFSFGCAYTKPVDDSKVDFEIEFELFLDLCGDAMKDGRKSGYKDRMGLRPSRPDTWVATWMGNHQVDLSILSTKSRKQVRACAMKGYEIGYEEPDNINAESVDDN